MSFETVLKGNMLFIPDELLEKLGMSRDEKLFLVDEDDGSLRIQKNKKDDVQAAFDRIHKIVQEKGGLEAAGLYNDDDVVNFIRELRNAKSTS